MRDEKGEQKSILHYKGVGKKLRKDVFDSKAVRGMFEGFDHYVVLAKMGV